DRELERARAHHERGSVRGLELRLDQCLRAACERQDQDCGSEGGTQEPVRSWPATDEGEEAGHGDLQDAGERFRGHLEIGMSAKEPTFPFNAGRTAGHSCRSAAAAEAVAAAGGYGFAGISILVILSEAKEPLPDVWLLRFAQDDEVCGRPRSRPPRPRNLIPR